MITEQMYKEAQEIVRLYELQKYELQKQKQAFLTALPTLEEGMVFEYKDLTGRWYEYTKELQESIYFVPLVTRVRMTEKNM